MYKLLRTLSDTQCYVFTSVIKMFNPLRARAVPSSPDLYSAYATKQQNHLTERHRREMKLDSRTGCVILDELYVIQYNDI